MNFNPVVRRKFTESELGVKLRSELVKMVESPDYNTKPIYSKIEYDDYQFVEKHMTYMSRFPNMSHHQYVMNLKLMTKIDK